MPDNLTTVTTVATPPSGTVIATRNVTYSGDAAAQIAPVGLVAFSGSDDAKTATDVPGGGGVEAAALRVTIASDSTGVLSVDDNGGSLTVDGTVTANAGSGTFAISAASLPLPTGAATSALQTQPGVDIGDVTINNSTGASAVNIQDGGNSITVDGTVTANAGTNLNTSALALDATLTGVIKTDDNAFTPATDKIVMIGAQADDTSPDSVNEGDAGALRMSLARALHIISVADTATLSSVNSSASSGQLLAANPNRIGVMIFNDDANALYVKYGTTATLTDMTVRISGTFGYWEMPFPIYTGRIDGIWAADGSGGARITELT